MALFAAYVESVSASPQSCRHGCESLPSTAKSAWQEVRHLLEVNTENNLMVFSSLNRQQKLPAAAEQWKEGRSASPTH